MPFDLNQFRSQIVYDGARPNLFEVHLTPPSGIVGNIEAGKKMRFFGRGAQLPGVSMGVASFFYMGREIKLPGNKTFPDWTITVVNDEDFSVRSAMERWMGKLNSHSGNIRMPGFMNNGNYTVNGSVIQYSKGGTGALGTTGRGATGGALVDGGATGIRKYNFIGLWPMDVSPIEVDWGANDILEEFNVTFAVQWWEVERDPEASIQSKVSVG